MGFSKINFNIKIFYSFFQNTFRSLKTNVLFVLLYTGLFLPCVILFLCYFCPVLFLPCVIFALCFFALCYFRHSLKQFYSVFNMVCPNMFSFLFINNKKKFAHYKIYHLMMAKQGKMKWGRKISPYTVNGNSICVGCLFIHTM